MSPFDIYLSSLLSELTLHHSKHKSVNISLNTWVENTGALNALMGKSILLVFLVTVIHISLLVPYHLYNRTMFTFPLLNPINHLF